MKKHLVIAAFAALVCPLVAGAKPPVFEKPLHFSPDGKKAYALARGPALKADGREGDEWLCCWVAGRESQRALMHQTASREGLPWEETSLAWSPDSRYLSLLVTFNKHQVFSAYDLEGKNGPEKVADSQEIIFEEICPELTGAKDRSYFLQWAAGNDLEVQVSELDNAACRLLLELKTGRILKIKGDGSRMEVRPGRAASKSGFWRRLFKK